MPYVNVKVAGNLSKEQKGKIAEGITRVIEETTGKPGASTYVVIDEVSKDNWAKSGILLSNQS